MDTNETTEHGEQTPMADAVTLKDLSERLNQLREAIEDKAEANAHQHELFDNLERQLGKYRRETVNRITDMMILDVIQLIDRINGDVWRYTKLGESSDIDDAERYARLLKVLKRLPSSMEAILYRQGIEPYTVPGDAVDPRRQKILQTVETDDDSKINTVAERLAPGYEHGSKVIRPEQIKVYKGSLAQK